MSATLLLVTLLASGAGQALTGVHPTGVNINRHGVSTVFLTFQGTVGETPGAAFWCMRLNATAATVTRTNPCVQGSIIGTLPARLDLSRASGPSGAITLPEGGTNDGRVNTTDIMTIPASVARRALQAARSGGASQFFYVREFFSSDGSRSFTSVTCRMAGTGARTPFALTNVDTWFVGHEAAGITFLSGGEAVPPSMARIRYTGTGRLRGRWEAVMPGEPQPTELDLLPAASLPVELRGMQKPYTVLSRFDVFLPPTGSFDLPGPPPDRLPTRLRGAYRLLLRIDATGDKEGDSNTLFGVAQSGGVAGFPMPVLRYYVGNPTGSNPANAALSLIGPPDHALVTAAQPLYLSWKDSPGGPPLQLQLKDDSEVLVFSATLPPGTGHYLVPAHVRAGLPTSVHWRVVDTRLEGRDSGWQSLQLEAGVTN
ncbi:MAG: SdpI family protein [Pseudomonadales bacterium]|nr:SdpI family protein [Pseudomonadales bacterium]